MNKIWYYVLTIFGSIGITLLLVYFYYNISNTFLFKRLKKNIPTDKKDMLDAGKPKEIDYKEVEKDERIELDKYREYERIRHIEERERRDGESVEHARIDKSTPERSDLKVPTINGNEENQQQPRAVVKLD